MITYKKRPLKRWSLLGENDLKAAFSVVRDRNKLFCAKDSLRWDDIHRRTMPRSTPHDLNVPQTLL